MDAVTTATKPARCLVVLLALWFALDAHAELAQPSGTVAGRVILSHQSEKRGTISIAGRDLSGVVIFMEPVDGEIVPTLPEKEATIRQKDVKFDPALLLVTRGQTVRFPNDDKIVHNVFSFSSAHPFDLGLYSKGESKSVTFTNTGPVRIFCSIHTDMHAVIYVTPNHLRAATDAKGRFHILNVPVGRYALQTWHRYLPDGVERVEVRHVDVQVGEPVWTDVDLSVQSGDTP
ncbi:MAG: carboxypeptidase regulatory-like domain-containing protein [Verrucomicrobia bacterium]|nr:carboxypeptidase regulatory-like domain-containing protein [Verrucomicrobiota bacterium]MDA1085459.1 carboxypeptidase regulatory-like domain-containing protein [Verrucomicrobiota bacterium]